MSPQGKSAPTPQQIEMHRAQVNLVIASLRAGVTYERPGRVAAKPSKTTPPR